MFLLSSNPFFSSLVEGRGACVLDWNRFRQLGEHLWLIRVTFPASISIIIIHETAVAIRLETMAWVDPYAVLSIAAS